MPNITEQEQWLRQRGFNVEEYKNRLGSGYADWVNQTYDYNIQGGDALRDKEAWLGTQGFNTAEYKNRLGAGYSDWVNQTYGYNNQPINRGTGRNQVTTAGTTRANTVVPPQYTQATSSDALGNITSDLGALDPGNIYIDDIASSFTRNILQQYGQDTEDALRYLRQAGQAGITGYQDLADFYNQSAGQINSLASQYGNIANQTYGTAANLINQSAQAGSRGISDAYNTGAATSDMAAQRALEYSQKGAQGQLADTDKMLSYYKSLAAQNRLPGQSLIEQNMGQNTAEAIRRMKEMGGSSLALLGGAANVYGNQQAGIRDLGIQAAQYQAGNQANLANAATNAIGLRSNAYGQQAAAQQIYGQNAQQTAALRGYGQEASTNMLTNAAQTSANMYGGAQERALANQQSAFGTGVNWQAAGKAGLTQAQADAPGNLSNYYSALSGQTSGLLQTLMDQRLGAEQQQADLQRRSILDATQTAGAGLQYATDAQNQAWQYNQLLPYQNLYNYYNQQQAAYDPFAAMMQMYGEKAGIQYGTQQQQAYNQAAQQAQNQQTIVKAMELVPYVGTLVKAGSANNYNYTAPQSSYNYGGSYYPKYNTDNQDITYDKSLPVGFY
jgi:hypothetical protein